MFYFLTSCRRFPDRKQIGHAVPITAWVKSELHSVERKGSKGFKIGLCFKSWSLSKTSGAQFLGCSFSQPEYLLETLHIYRQVKKTALKTVASFSYIFLRNVFNLFSELFHWPKQGHPNLCWCNYPVKVVVRYSHSGIDDYSSLTRWGEGHVGSLEGMWAFYLIRGTNIFVIIIILFSTVFLQSNGGAKLLFIFGYHPR